MSKKNINRIKVVLVDKGKTNKWLAAELGVAASTVLGVAASTVSKWCTNDAQPSLETLMKISVLLDTKVDDLLRFDEL